MPKPLKRVEPIGNGSYADDSTCGPEACHAHGICSNTSCYCNKYFSGDHCEKGLAHPGVTIKESLLFYGVSLCLGLITGGFVAKVYNSNGRKLFLWEGEYTTSNFSCLTQRFLSFVQKSSNFIFLIFIVFIQTFRYIFFEST